MRHFNLLVNGKRVKRLVKVFIFKGALSQIELDLLGTICHVIMKVSVQTQTEYPQTENKLRYIVNRSQFRRVFSVHPTQHRSLASNSQILILSY